MEIRHLGFISSTIKMPGKYFVGIVMQVCVVYVCVLLQSVDSRMHMSSNHEYKISIDGRNVLNLNEPIKQKIVHHAIGREMVAKQREAYLHTRNRSYRESRSLSRSREFDNSFQQDNTVHKDTSKWSPYKMRNTAKVEFFSDRNSRQHSSVAVTGERSIRRRRQTEIYDGDLNSALEIVQYMQEKGSQNCSRVTLPILNISTANDTYSEFDNQAKAAVKTANLLNTFYQTTTLTDKSNSSYLGDDNTYFALVRNNVESDDNIFGSCIAFNSHEYKTNIALFAPYAFRSADDTVVTKDLAVLNYTSRNEGVEWFSEHSGKPFVVYNMHEKFGYHLPRHNETHFSERLNLTHLHISESEGYWTVPYFDCGGGNNWMVTYSVPFYGSSTNKFRGVVTVDIDLRKVDINQCATDSTMFSGTHKCKNTTQCVHIPEQGFTSGAYQCVCNENYYFPFSSTVTLAFNGTDLENEYRRKMLGEPNNYDEDFECLPCHEGCDGCIDDTPCFIQENVVLRTVLLGIEVVCMLMVLILMILIFRLRKFKVIRHDSPYMLEIVLFGALLLYGAVVTRYFSPDTLICFLVRWLREWGFAVAYGTLILKTYRILAIFQTRSATRVLVRDRDLMKWLGLILFILAGYLAAWTGYSVDEMTNCGRDMLDIGVVQEDDLKYYICKTNWWDIAIEAAEFLFLIFGIYLCYLVRSAPSEYNETRYISIAIYNETIFSLFLHVARHFVWLTAGPDWIYLMYVIRSQLTTTVMLCLIFIPKFAVVYKMKTSEHFRERAYSEAVSLESKLRSAANSANSFNNPNFNQEDVREELKRLYTQLEIYKTKTMKIDNPHIPKKKGGLGARWKTARKFSRRFSRSLQAPGHDSDRERSSEIARSTESLARPVEMDDIKHIRDEKDSDHRDMIGNSTRHGAHQKWMCQQ